MNYSIKLFSVITILLLLIVGFSFSEDKTNSGPVFVDLDGDGLNDNDLDIENGFFLDDTPSVLCERTVNPFAAIEEAEPVVLPQSNFERFSQIRFDIRDICVNRYDFDAGFGGSSGASGGGSSSGSHCVGGICY